ncbi:non-ribosomal peptide synthetase [Marinibactrum halimedae]|uniref:Carrier domain-containing protein n=1 Tax=Marinibactrum halimedae TaxID=1444977 RepID=A0AA37T6P3_9GAMM|nr:non-ribosomal peptide synthetase [Marinibactrum halimedae]MCD9460857.1 amino acid adenylation domain-containing protein [Marinibactrum halimedae]GLS24565.1 hypothetical protein GCM10007877_02790 [Marinibactrum halimedae]
MAIVTFLNKVKGLGIKLWLEDSQLKFKAPKGVWNAEIRDELRANKSAVIAFLKEEDKRATAEEWMTIQSVARVDENGNIMTDFPLSFSQERLWFIDQLESNSVSYNIPIAVNIESTVHSPLNVSQLEHAFHLIIDRHENLRTIFPSHKGKARQRILDKFVFILEQEDLSFLDSEQERHEEAQRRCEIEAKKPFDLACGPLLRAKIFKLSDQRHILMLNMHHIISDGWSMGVLVKEFAMIMAALNQGQEPLLPPLDIQYLDYSLWQRKWLGGESRNQHDKSDLSTKHSTETSLLQKQLNYWQQKLAGAPENLNLPTDFTRPSTQSFEGGRHYFQLDAQITKRLKQLAEKQDCTLYMVLLAVFNVLLYRYSHQEDICIGSPVANRHYDGTERLIGLFINTLVLRHRVKGEATFTSLLSDVKTTSLEAFENQDTPFEKIVDVVQPNRNAAISPLFQVMFILQNTPTEVLAPGMSAYPLDVANSKFDITLDLKESTEGLKGSFEYGRALFKPDTMARMADHFRAICQAVVDDPDAKVGELNFIRTAETQQLLNDFNGERVAYANSQAQCIHHFFTEQVNRNPDNIAVIDQDERLSYRELCEQSQRLALYLQSMDIGPDSLVGICINRSPQMLVAMLGILQAGGAYVPLDPGYPQERLEHMLNDSRVSVVLTEADCEDKLADFLAKEVELVVVDVQWQDICAQVDTLRSRNIRLKEEVTPEHLSYVIYTSGSTGKAKGVAIEHRNAVALINWAQDVYHPQQLSGVLAATSISFDLSVYEIFLTLAVGGKVILAPNIMALPEVARPQEITLINTVPSAIEELIDLKAVPDSVTTINLAGEPLSTRLVTKLYEQTSVEKVYDLYGPSEDTTYSTYTLRHANGVQTIGKPITNTQAYVLDSFNNPVPSGVPGELYLAGDGVARGYLYRPELSAEKFLPNPFIDGSRMYKTGDLVRWREDGNLEYLGRIDTQVKIRGFRIEIGEIEARLNEHQALKDSVVVAQGQATNKRLVAYYVAVDSTGDDLMDLAADELRRHLQQGLPDYMLPVAFVSVREIPLMPNGKVNRLLLSSLDVEVTSEQAYFAPRSNVEKQLVAIWSEVLGLAPENIGIQDNFFELGGDSIKTIQIVAKAIDQGIHFTTRDMFNHQNIQALLQNCDTDQSKETIHESGMLEGEVALSPIQQHFFEHHHTSRHHYNQSVLLNLTVKLSEQNVTDIVTVLMKQHDALRLRFSQTAHGWQQEYLGAKHITSRMGMTYVDLQGANTDAVTRVCNELQASLDLDKGPLIRWAYFKGAQNDHIRDQTSGDQLSIMVHHLVIDGVSWRILLEDLNQLIDQQRNSQPLALTQKRSSYRNWVDSLATWQDSEKGRQDLAWWRLQADKLQTGHDLAVTKPLLAKGYRQEDMAQHNVRLSREATEKLLKHCHQAYGTHINDLLMSAVMLGYFQSTGSLHLTIDMEGHGREQIQPTIDITRTLGWFTSLYPVSLSLSDPEDVGQCIKDVKAALHAVPNKGVGFPIFRYMNQDDVLRALPEAQVVFNFLGDFQAKAPDSRDRYFTFSENTCGNNSAGNREVAKRVTINGMVVFNQLSFDFSYPQHWQGEAICSWQDHFVIALESLINHCCNAPRLGYTPDDFPLLKISTAQLDDIIPVLENQRHITLDNIQDIYPLTPLQSGILFETLLADTDDNKGMYITQSAIGFHGQAERSALQQAWQRVVNHYDALRMQVIADERMINAAGMQVIQKQCDAKIDFLDWSDKSDAELKDACIAQMAKNKRAGIRYTTGPLMRMSLLQGKASSYLLFEQHHIMLDGWSQNIVLSNLFNLYQALVKGQDYNLPATAPYRAYVQLLLNRDQQAEAEYWQQYLSAHEEVTPLPFARLADYDREAMSLNSGPKEAFESARLSLSKDTTQQLEQLVKKHRLTMNTVLQFVWGVVLHLHSGNPSITFGSVSSGRNGLLDVKHNDQMVGLCINTTPTCIQFDALQTLLAQLTSMQARESEKLGYEITPLVEIQESLSAIGENDINTNQDFFQTLFVYENYPIEKISETSNLLKDFIGNEAPNYPLALTAFAQETLEMTFTWDAGYYSEASISNLMAQFERITLQLLEKPDALIKDLSLLPEDDKQRILTEFNQTSLDYDQSRCIHHLLAQQVEQYPDKTAVIYQGTPLSYQQLFDKSRTLALYLQNANIRPDTLVGVCMDRSADMVIAMLGIMQSGGAYVPMNPDYPVDRLNYMMEDSQAPIVLTQEKYRSRISDVIVQNTRLITIDDDWAEVSRVVGELTSSQVSLREEVTAKNLAYVIYTSGSTGKPKGVMIEHRNLHALCAWHQKAFRVDIHSRATQVANMAFDASVWEMWPYLLSAATLCVVDDETYTDIASLHQFLTDHQISHSFLPTPMAQQLMQREVSGLTHLQYLLIGGDKLSKYEAKSYPFTLVNNYGPTESTVVATSTTIEGSFTVQNIGAPISNTQVYILDQYNNPVPVGVPGELRIAGCGLARGYLNRPELTQEKFVANPYSDTHRRLYKSGDLACWLPNGQIEYLGRIDNQVKIRSYRIEVGEIESRFTQHNRVQDGAVIVQEVNGNKQLVAFYVAHGSHEQGLVEIPREEFKAWLRQTLPHYMIPTAFVGLAAMPLTPNGKVNRQALALMQANHSLEQDYVAPRSAIEKQLANIWGEILSVEASQIGLHDNFFELGGDSIKIIQVVAKATAQGIHFDVRDMFNHQSIYALLSHCDVSKSREIIKEQGILAGHVPLSPVQRYFFDHCQTDLHHFNQSVLLNLQSELSFSDLVAIIQTLMTQHDALRLRYQHIEGKWQQYYDADIPAEAESLGIHTYNIDHLEIQKIPGYVEDVCNHWQTSLDLENGPIMRCLYFDGQSRHPNQLAIIIHHLAIDGVSWRILLEDLNQLIDQQLAKQPLQLVAKRSSYRNWVEDLSHYQETEQGQADLSWWNDFAEKAQNIENVFDDKTFYQHEMQQHEVVLSKADTQKLMKHCHEAYGTTINDLLIAALMLSYCQSTGHQEMLLHMEGHGRELLHPSIDITKTLGWFTSLYPVHLTLSNPRDMGQSIKDIKTTLHSIPNKGVGFSIFKYVNQSEIIRKVPQAQVVFNFLGDFQSSDRGEKTHHFRLSDNSTGTSSSKQREAFRAITINGAVVFDQLSFSFSYPQAWQREKVNLWPDHFIAALKSLVEHCCETSRLGFTPDDFPLLNASLPQLDSIIPALHQTRNIELDNIQDIFPLTPLQSGMLFETLYSQTDSNNGMYLTQSAIGFQGQADINVLQQAWQQVVNHYDALRMQVITDNSAGINEGLQVILKKLEVNIKLVDWKEKNDEALKAACDIWMQESKRSGINFEQGPLLRMTLFQGQNCCYLLFEQHHIVLDGWSQSIVLSNLFKLYQSLLNSKQKIHSLPATAPYSAYLKVLTDTCKQEETAFWQDYLSQYDVKTPLPMASLTEYNNELAAREAFHETTLTLSAEVSVKLETMLKAHRITMNTALQCIWGLLLHLHSGNKTVMFGSVSSGRSGLQGVQNGDQMVGLCINTTPTCMTFDGQRNLLEQLKQMQSRESQKLHFETTSLTRIQAMLDNSNNDAFFQTLFVYENYPVEKISDNNRLIVDFMGDEAPNYPLSLRAISEGSIALTCTWDGYFYTEKHISVLMGQFERLLQQLTVQPECPIQDFRLITAAEKQLTLTQYNQTQYNQTHLDYPRNQCLHEWFEEQVNATPDAIAVAAQGESLSFQQLYERSQRLALYLQSVGVKPDTLVGLCVERSLDMMVGILGILQAGGAYVPLDPSYPEDRLAYMLEDSQACLVITQARYQSKLSALAQADRPLLVLDTQQADIDACADLSLTRAVRAPHLAYVIYTSGSTGKPKGVMVEHRSIVNHMQWIIHQLALGVGKSVLQKTAFNFDAAQWELMALLGGSTVVMAAPGIEKDPQQLHDAIVTHQITTLQCVPVLLNALLEQTELHQCDSLEAILCGGELLEQRLVERCQQALPAASLYNLYGPTECTIDATFYDCSAQPAATSSAGAITPIGIPVNNTQVYVLDPYQNPQPIGVPGELHIAGDCLARGYLGRPELTEERFIDNPFNPGTRLYKTGDLVRWLEDGNLECLGRMDTQVKIRGYRIETGEIEARLNEHSALSNAVVVAQGEASDQRLIAFYVTVDDAEQPTIESLRTHLLQTLPDYMVPAVFQWLEAIPLTPNGKVNRRLLEARDVSIVSDSEYIGPSSEFEQQLVDILANVLQREPNTIGMNDNFFELGGHSLLATQVISKIRSQLEIEFPMKAFFSVKTLADVADIAQVIIAQHTQEPSESVLADEDFEELSL